MKRIIAFGTAVLLTATAGFGQKVSGKEKFGQGQTLELSLQTKTTVSQEAMGQAIEFNLSATALHLYKVTNATEDNNTLHHQMQQVTFNFDGMGQKFSFNSNNEKDMNGRFGKPIKELLGKTYDMIIDPYGKVLMVRPEKMDTVKTDDRMAIVTNMMKEVFGAVLPPKKGSYSFFQVFPDHEVSKGDTWNEVTEDPSGRSATLYTLTDINDSTIIVDFKRNAMSVSKAEMMGNESTTTMNSKSTGKIIIDKVSGIVREKTATTESTGTTEVMGTTLPVTSKTTSTIIVSLPR